MQSIPNKTLIDQENSSSSLELSDTEKEKNSISSTSKPAFEDFKVPGYSDKETRNSSERKRSENISDVKTDSYKKKKSKRRTEKKNYSDNDIDYNNSPYEVQKNYLLKNRE